MQLSGIFFPLCLLNNHTFQTHHTFGIDLELLFLFSSACSDVTKQAPFTENIAQPLCYTAQCWKKSELHFLYKAEGLVI